MEIERQFLIKDIAVVPVDNATAKHEIQQGYLSFEPELRIRQMDDAYFLTFKSSGGLVRREEEICCRAYRVRCYARRATKYQCFQATRRYSMCITML